MLSDATIDVIRQTIPVLEENGEALTRYFYERMFKGNPEVKAFFNPAHQHAGTQQRALAAAICAYARHIDNPQALAGAVQLIAHKHASLGIKPEHYPIVGKHLLGSIQELLGLDADDPIIKAWGEAYQVLAEVFTQREDEIYVAHERTHCQTGFQPFTVIRKQRESDVITSFYLQPTDGGTVGPFHPGQYLTVRLPGPDGGTTMRNYSISSGPNDPHYRISVKREPAATEDAPVGYVSHYLHEQVNVGDTIEVGPPCGVFTLDVSEATSRPLMLLSAGVGITPCLAMLHAALKHQPDRPIYFIHAALNSDTHAFGQELATLDGNHSSLHVHVRYSHPTADDQQHGYCDSEGFVDDVLIRSMIGTPDAEFYYCGPSPFMASIHNILLEWSVAENQLHHEFFGPAEALQTVAAG